MTFSLIELTLRVAIVATLINLPLALAVSWYLGRPNAPGRFLIEVIVSLPLALPPVSIGFFLLLLLGREGVIGAVLAKLFAVDLVFTWIAATIAAAVVSFPLMARAVMVAMSGVDKRLELAARSLGASRWRVFATITLPLAYRGILAGMLLGFVRALSEFGATIVVAGNIEGKTQTLPLAIYTSVMLRDDNQALILILVSIVLAAVTLAVHNWLLTRDAVEKSL
jgi:molybdate transport system permease protein|tara:strand:- start:885 stop:1556 length:672 start_codon:yes stop_codon:yes gene_type:complete